MKHEPFLPGLGAPAAPMTPARYIELRRRAAGLTVAQVARRVDPAPRSPSHWPVVEQHIRLSETPGVRLKPYLIEDLNRKAYPIDVEVYRQLCDDPVDHHPTLCPGCACTSWTACQTHDGGECRIDDDGICTACKEKARREAVRRAA